MALFNHLFPYSNLHDINLDWIISIIKSIDPAVIQALQELTPDIIEQVNQKVNEAQAAAIAAQSSASEANTARENAATSAAEAAQDATAAEAAKTTVVNSLTVTSKELLPVAGLTTDINRIAKSGKTAFFTLRGQLTISAGSEYYTNIATLPDGITADGEFIGMVLISDKPSSLRVYGKDVSVESSKIVNNPYFQIYDFVFPIQ